MASDAPACIDRIVTDPAVMVGKPVVKGTRIPVELVLKRLAQEPDLDELFAAFLRLTLDDLEAVLGYAQAVVEGSTALAAPAASPSADRAEW